MEASEGVLPKNNPGENNTIASLLVQHKSQDQWISDEEFYTEGSSDEDDMALRIKQRERREARREKSTGSTAQISLSDSRLVSDLKETSTANIRIDEDCDDTHKWRPTRGSLKLKSISDPEHEQFLTSNKEPHG